MGDAQRLLDKLNGLVTDDALKVVEEALEGKFKRKLAEVKDGDKHITVEDVKVVEIFPTKAYKKGHYRRAAVEQDGKRKLVVAFNKNIGELARLKRGDTINIRNVDAAGGSLIVNPFTVIEVVKEEPIRTIKELLEGWKGETELVNVKGVVRDKNDLLFLVGDKKGIALYSGYGKRAIRIKTTPHPLLKKDLLPVNKTVALLDALFDGSALYIISRTRVFVAKDKKSKRKKK